MFKIIKIKLLKANLTATHRIKFKKGESYCCNINDIIPTIGNRETNKVSYKLYSL